jgi:2'-5' RNA ligase
LQVSLALPGADPLPHITLKMPFHRKATLAEVRQRIQQVAAATRPIPIALRGVGGFPGPFTSAIYATIQPNRRLHALHARLVRALHLTVENVLPYTEEIELQRYVPHITLATDLTRADYRRLMRRLRNCRLEGRFELAELELICRGRRGTWARVALIPLGTAPRQVGSGGAQQPGGL